MLGHTAPRRQATPINKEPPSPTLVSSWGTVLDSTSTMSLSEPQCAGLHSGWSPAAFSRRLSAGRVGGGGRWDRSPSLHPGVLSCVASLVHSAGRHCAQGLGPSPYHALQFVGARDLVSPTFGFLLLRLAFFPRICCLITLTRSWKASSTLRGGSLALVSIYGILCLVAISFPCSLVIFLK